MSLRRYYHTIKYLRPKQILYRLYYFFRKPSAKPFSQQSIRSFSAYWPLNGFGTARITQDGLFSCFHETGSIHHPSVWNDVSHTKLWLYNLHYFDVLNSTEAALDVSLLVEYIDKWCECNELLKGNAWEPYPLSLRAVNWIKFFTKESLVPKPSWLVSLQWHAEILMQQVEYHLLGNHVFANAKALIFLGSYFVGERASIWLQRGLHILKREIPEQFLADGAHMELSPMYHAILIWDLCDLVFLANQTALEITLTYKKDWEIIIQKGLVWLRGMLHPDGDIAFFNDAAFGIAPTYSALLQYAKMLNIALPKDSISPFALMSFKESGYYALQLPYNGKAILDLAKVGPDYQPGHAHADTLSFELSLFGLRVLVNSGISEYEIGSNRLFQRGTSAHNTIYVDGKNSSDIWSGFRVAERARPFDLSIREEPDSIYIACSHDGYKKLVNGCVHRRTWHFSRRQLLLTDYIYGSYKEAIAMFYFHPEVCIIKLDAHMVECTLPNQKRLLVEIRGAQSVVISSSFWYPFFGQAVTNQSLLIRFNGSNLKTLWTW